MGETESDREKAKKFILLFWEKTLLRRLMQPAPKAK